eukprot:8545766-Pyramimonas_sp.AAC.1
MVHPKDVSLVCDAALTTLGYLYHWDERIGHIPAAIALNSVVLLPRPDSGFRPIGLLPGFLPCVREDHQGGGGQVRGHGGTGVPLRIQRRGL